MDRKKLEAVKRANALLGNCLKSCSICPRTCGVDRTAGKSGYCRAAFNSVVYSYSPHHGEEPPISGTRGSGTIFFSHCNMKCAYCQNYDFSQLDKGEEVTTDKLAAMMLSLQKRGCHNINLVTPTHYVPQILASLEMALEGGLEIPIVYNTSGYDLVETIRALDGVVDIYLPDMRYSDDTMAGKYSDAVRYVEHNRACVREMQAQVGDLVMDGTGIAKRGIIIRLLALPGGISGTERSLRYIREHVSPGAYLSIMSQYYPTFKAHQYTEISRSISVGEYKNVVDAAHLLSLNKGWIQEAPEEFEPRFFGTNIKPTIDRDGKEDQ